MIDRFCHAPKETDQCLMLRTDISFLLPQLHTHFLASGPGSAQWWGAGNEIVFYLMCALDTMLNLAERQPCVIR